MKKFVIPFIIGLLVALPLGTFAATKIISARFTDNVVEINNRPISGEVAAIQKEGEKNPSSYLNLQAVAQGLGGRAYVESDGKTIQIEVLTDLEKVAKACKNSCVMLYAYHKDGSATQGSGWVYNGYVITARHVIEGATKIDVFLDDSLYSVPGTVFYTDKDLDVAIVKADTKLPSVTLGNSDYLIEGEKLVSITSPKGHQNSIDECIDSGPAYVEDGTFINLSESNTENGSSGGPIFNYQNEIVGLLIKGGNVADYAIPINDIKPILEKIK